MSKNHAIAGGRAAKGIVAVAAVGALALSGLALGTASAATSVKTKVVYSGSITAETDAGYPAEGWFVGQNGTVDRSATVSGTTLSLSAGTQFLYKLPTPDTDVSALIASGFNSNVTSAGDETFQIFITWDGGFTTLRSAVGTTAKGVVTAKLTDQWISSHSLTGASGETDGTLASLIADLNTKSGGTYEIDAVGVFGGKGPNAERTTPTTISSIQFDNTKYTFAQSLTVAKATTSAKVQLSSIGLETGEGWPSNTWFYGDNAETSPQGSMVGANLVLPAIPADGSQLLHQFTDANRPASLPAFVESGLAFTLAAGGEASFQIPLTYGPGNTFLTLRSDDFGAGTNNQTYATQWRSSKTIGTGDNAIIANQLYPLSQIVAAIEEAGGSTKVLAFGVETANGTASAALASVQAAGTKYTFEDTKTLSFNSVSITGTPQVNATVTAASEVNGPDSGVTVTYKWVASSKTVATGTTFQIPTSLSGKKLTVTATAAASTYKSGSATSSSVTVAAANFDSSTATISNTTPTIGDTLTATATSSPSATKYAYQWYRGTAKISGATKSTYKVAVADLGAALAVKVTPTLTGYSSTVFSSDPTDQVSFGSFTLGAATLSGTQAVGKTLTASATASISGVTKVYEFVAGASDSGAILQFGSSSKYKIPSYLAGTTVSVIVIAYAPGYTSQSSASDASIG